MRNLIRMQTPDVVEEWRWISTPIWSRDGIICSGEPYKNIVKLTSVLWRVRATDIHNGEAVDE